MVPRPGLITLEIMNQVYINFLGMERYIMIKSVNIDDVNRVLQNTFKPEFTSNIEGVVLDLRLLNVYHILGGGYIFEDVRNTGKVEPVKTRFYLNRNGVFCLHPVVDVTCTLMPAEKANVWSHRTNTQFNCYQLEIESVHVPEGYYMMLQPRVTALQCGLVINHSHVNAGYEGKLYVSCFNLTNGPIYLQRYCRIMGATLHEIRGKYTPYNGLHQGGLVGTDGKDASPY